MKFSCVVVRLVVDGDAFPTSLSAVWLWKIARVSKCLPTCDGIIHNIVDFSQFLLLRLVIVVSQRFTIKLLGADCIAGIAFQIINNLSGFGVLRHELFLMGFQKFIC